jgi:hypothetical protein
VLNGTPFFIPEKFQSFIASKFEHLFGSEPSTQFPETLKLCHYGLAYAGLSGSGRS